MENIILEIVFQVSIQRLQHLEPQQHVLTLKKKTTQLCKRHRLFLSAVGTQVICVLLYIYAFILHTACSKFNFEYRLIFYEKTNF